MKKVAFALIACLFLTSCFNPKDDTSPLTVYSPVMMKRAELETSIKLEAPRAVTDAGKIYLKDDYIFLNDRFDGIHIFDNSNPAAPVKKGYIRVPGSIDIAVKGTTMYVDNATDLVGIDISDLANIRVVSRVPNAFPELLPPDLGYLPDVYKVKKRPAGLIIVGWKHN